jgi:subtilisin family serine protease
MTRSNRVPSASFPSAILVAALTFAALAPAARTAHAAPAPLRDYVPAQAGYRPQANPVATFAPGRVLIKFTPAALRQASFAAPADKGGAVAGARTGLASLDGLLGSAVSHDSSARWSTWRTRRPAPRRPPTAGMPPPWLRTPTCRSLRNNWQPMRTSKRWNWTGTCSRPPFPTTRTRPPTGATTTPRSCPAYGWGGTYDHTLATTVGTVGFDANAPQAWDASQAFGSASIVIAIIDSGVDMEHTDIRKVTGYDFGDNDTNPDDNATGAGHGTCCAGVAAAMNNGVGAVGVAAGCSIMPLKVANSAGSMAFTAIQNALYYAADNGADIISMSLGAAISTDAATNTAIQYAYNAGCTILAATGNENKTVISYPAINTYVIGVGAASPCGDRKRSSSLSTEVNPGVSTDPRGYTCDGERWWGSNYGVTTKDAAGAVDILGPDDPADLRHLGSGRLPHGDIEPFFNGTSCATPYVAGVAALIKSANPGVHAGAGARGAGQHGPRRDQRRVGRRLGPLCGLRPGRRAGGRGRSRRPAAFGRVRHGTSPRLRTLQRDLHRPVDRTHRRSQLGFRRCHHGHGRRADPRIHRTRLV